MIPSRLHRLADALLESGALKFGSFKLKIHETKPDAPLSPFYMNLRTPDNPKPGPITSEHLHLIAGAMVEWIVEKDLAFDAICGIPNAGTPMMETLGVHYRGAHQLKLVKEEQGGKRWIDRVEHLAGAKPGMTVLLIDDVITGADTKLEAIRVLHDAEFVVVALLVVVDRQQFDGVETVEEVGVRTDSIFTITNLMDYYLMKGKLDAAKRSEALTYIAESSR